MTTLQITDDAPSGQSAYATHGASTNGEDLDLSGSDLVSAARASEVGRPCGRSAKPAATSAQCSSPGAPA